jgi:hypothetical protein
VGWSKFVNQLVGGISSLANRFHATDFIHQFFGVNFWPSRKRCGRATRSQSYDFVIYRYNVFTSEKIKFILKTRYAISCVANFYNAGDVTRHWVLIRQNFTHYLCRWVVHFGQYYLKIANALDVGSLFAEKVLHKI